jgi:hypothetical protein
MSAFFAGCLAPETWQFSSEGWRARWSWRQSIRMVTSGNLGVTTTLRTWHGAPVALRQCGQPMPERHEWSNPAISRRLPRAG